MPGGTVNGESTVAFSGNDIVSTMPINALHRAIGIALETVGAAGTVKYARTDEKVPGVLTGATFGTRYFWSGSVLTTTQPSVSGQYVHSAGIAANATDLIADVDFIKKNI